MERSYINPYSISNSVDSDKSSGFCYSVIIDFTQIVMIIF